MIAHMVVLVDNKDGTYEIVVSDDHHGENKADEVRKLLDGQLRYVSPMRGCRLERKWDNPKPQCRNCDGTGQCGWGLTREGKAYAMVPCISCYPLAYQERVDEVMAGLKNGK
jgi:hypothetical protein